MAETKRTFVAPRELYNLDSQYNKTTNRYDYTKTVIRPADGGDSVKVDHSTHTVTVTVERKPRFFKNGDNIAVSKAEDVSWYLNNGYTEVILSPVVKG